MRNSLVRVLAAVLCLCVALAPGPAAAMRVATATWNVGDQSDVSETDVGTLYASLTNRDTAPDLVVLAVQECFDFALPEKFEKASGGLYTLVVHHDNSGAVASADSSASLSSVSSVDDGLLWASNRGNKMFLATEVVPKGSAPPRRPRSFPARGGTGYLTPHGMTGVMVFRRAELRASMEGAIDIDMSTWKTAASKGGVAAVVRVDPEGGETTFVVAISCHLPSGESQSAERKRLARLRDVSLQVDESLRGWGILEASVVWAGDFNSRTVISPEPPAGDLLGTREGLFVLFVERLRMKFGSRAMLKNGAILQNPGYRAFDADGKKYGLVDQLSKPEAREAIAASGYQEAGPLEFPPTCFKVKHTATTVHGILGGRDNQRHMLCGEESERHCLVSARVLDTFDLEGPCKEGACYTFRSGKQAHDDQASIPGYCDRVLVKTPPGWTHSTAAYGSLYGLGSSDHAPVVALIDLVAEAPGLVPGASEVSDFDGGDDDGDGDGAASPAGPGDDETEDDQMEKEYDIVTAQDLGDETGRDPRGPYPRPGKLGRRPAVSGRGGLGRREALPA